MLLPGMHWIFHVPGLFRIFEHELELIISEGRLYLQASAKQGSRQHQSFGEWSISSLVSIQRRRHELRHSALQLVFTPDVSNHAIHTEARPNEAHASGSMLLNFNAEGEREQAIQVLISMRPTLRTLEEKLQEFTEQWRRGILDNYSYLMRLNECASRSFADLSQYPIM